MQTRKMKWTGFVFMMMFLMVLVGCSSTTSTPAGEGAGDGTGDTPGTEGGADSKDGEDAPATPADPTTPAAATYTISGKVSGGALQGVKVTLSGAASAEATTGADGSYSFTGLSVGDYTVAVSKDSAVFNPVSTVVTLSTADVEANFTSAAYQPLAIPSTGEKDGVVGWCTEGDPMFDIGLNAVGKRAGSGCELILIERLYLYFDLSNINTQATLVSAALSFEQTITDPTPYTSGGALTIDHVDYEDTLTADDWNGVGMTVLNEAIATNSSSNGEVSIGTDLAAYVRTDLAGASKRTQLRFRFSDDEGALAVGSYINVTDPKLLVTYYQF